MKHRDHLLNVWILSIGLSIGFDLNPMYTILPLTLGVMFPDIDCFYGTHRKTLHNLPTLFIFAGYPMVMSNLHFVWIGIVAHYLLDLVGSRRGMALLYPLSSREYSFPGGTRQGGRGELSTTLIISVIEMVMIIGLQYILLHI